MSTPQVLLFDLFGTIALFASQVPTVRVGHTERRTTMHWLEETVAALLPAIPFERFLAAVMEVTAEISQQRAPEYEEIPSATRFLRTLERLHIPQQDLPTLARQLSLRHMDYLASLTTIPATHVTVLQTLATRYRFGVISNFDHAPTARRILARSGVDSLFETIVISEAFGRRKPHPAIFQHTLATLDVSPDQALYIGDSLHDDVHGAHNADLPVIWINAEQRSLPAHAPIPAHQIRRFEELLSIL